MNYNSALRYIFDDKEWLSKLGLGVVIMIVPILNFAWIGYQIQVIRNVKDGKEIILPAWDDLGKKFTDGLFLVLAGVIYSLPAILLAILPLSLMFIPLLASENQDLFTVLMTGSSIVYFCLSCLIILYALALSIFFPLVMVNYTLEGTFASCFKLRLIIQTISKNASSYFMIWLVNIGVTLGASMAISIAGGIVGWIPLLGQIALLILGAAGSMYPVLFSSHLYGQFSAKVSSG